MWGSVLIFSYFERDLKEAVMGRIDKPSGVALIVCPFGRILVVGSLLGPDHLSHGFLSLINWDRHFKSQLLWP